jgi:hypothetical protein
LRTRKQKEWSGLTSPAKFTKNASSTAKLNVAKFMSEDDAKKAGYREAKTETSTKAKSKTADTKQK